MARRLLHLVVLIIFSLVPLQCKGDAAVSTDNGSYVRHEVRLLNDILVRAHKFARPVKEQNETVHIKFGLALVSIDEVDEQSRTLTSLVWLRQLWLDAFLTWDPLDYGGITAIRVPVTKLWTPDLTVYNAKDHFIHTFDALGIVYSSGDVLWIPPATITSMCTFDMTYFPFDEQECDLIIGSWTYDGYKVSPDFYEGLAELDLTDYKPNPEWTIVSSGAKLNTTYYPCCPEPYPDLTFTLRIRRNPGYYSYIYLGPAVLLALLAPFVFLLPPGDTQKMTLGCGILVCFTLLFGRNGDFPREHTNVPLIDMYYMAQYVLLSLSIAMTVIVANIAKRARSVSGGEPSEFLRKMVLGCLGRCMCVSYDPVPEPFGADSTPDDKTTDGEAEGGRRREWLIMATIVDRFLFGIYLVLTILVTLCVLLRRP